MASNNERLTMVIGAHVILRKGTKILLARRCNTSYGDGMYNLPCGHLDPDETVAEAALRETAEEVGVTINSENLKLVGSTHWHSSSNKQSVNFFFECREWQGEPKIMEPDKCDEVAWFELNDLPPNLLKQPRLVLEKYRSTEGCFLIEDRD